MNQPAPKSSSPLDDLVEQLRKDQEAGCVKELHEYLARAPHDAEAIAREYIRIQDGEATGQQVADGDSIGPYKVERELGRGGQGVVYLAEDSRLGRKVALKVLTHLGPGSEDTVRRFQREAEVASKLEHAGICGVHDAGQDGGVPYIAMQYVEGETLAERLSESRQDRMAEELSSVVLFSETVHRDARAPEGDDQNTPGSETSSQSTSVTKREILDILQVFEKTARALHAAHEAGVVHRDIKPGNIILNLEGEPVILDFGLARSEDADTQTLTRTGDLFGTPAYMSPEQLTRGSIRLDRRTDVYSLGATLYECLTLKRPFEAPTREALYQTIMTRDAPDPRKLNRALTPDLKVVLEKSLEKDRDRRYETALEFAEELRRVRVYEPIQARPVTRWMRTRRWAQRNPGVAVSLGLFILALVLGVVGTTAGMLAANDESNRANAATKTAKLSARSEAAAKVEAQENEKKARDEAQRADAAKERESKARRRAETITEFVITALRAGDAHTENVMGAGQEMTVLAAMENAIRDIDSGRFREAPDIEAGLRFTIGTILMNNGRLKTAKRLLVEAKSAFEALDPSYEQEVAGIMPQILHDLARAERALGHLEMAESLCTQALELCRRLEGAENPTVLRCLTLSALVQGDLGRTEEAERQSAKVVEMCQRLYQGDHPGLATALNNLATARKVVQGPAAAEPLYVQAIEMRRRLSGGDHPNLAKMLDNLGKLRMELGRGAEGVSLLTEALEMRRRLYKNDHPDLAGGLLNLANTLQDLGRSADAAPLYLESLEIKQRLFNGDHEDVAGGLLALANVRNSMGDYARAESCCVQALEMYERLHGRDHASVLKSKNRLAVILWKMGKLKRAIPLLEEVVAARESNLGRGHFDTLGAIGNLGVNYLYAARLAEAIPLLEEAYRASKQHPKLRGFAVPLLSAHARATATQPDASAKGLALMREIFDGFARTADPRKSRDRANAVDLTRQLLPAARLMLPKDSPELAQQLAQFGLLLLWLRAIDEAEPLLREALTIREATAPDDWRTFNSKSMLGGALLGQKKFQESELLLLSGYRGLKDHKASIPPQGRPRFLEALERLVHLYEQKGDASEAAGWRKSLDEARSQ